MLYSVWQPQFDTSPSYPYEIFQWKATQSSQPVQIHWLSEFPLQTHETSRVYCMTPPGSVISITSCLSLQQLHFFLCLPATTFTKSCLFLQPSSTTKTNHSGGSGKPQAASETAAVPLTQYCILLPLITHQK